MALWQRMKPAERVALVVAVFSIVAAIIGIIAHILDIVPWAPKQPNGTVAPVISLHAGKPIYGSSFSVYPSYDPSGYMGDTHDIIVQRASDTVCFVYETKGQSPHEWEYKYINGELNSNPCKFAGVMYLNPPNNWGEDPNGGFDLRDARGVIRWEAQSLTGKVNVEFVIGGVTWKWNERTKEKEAVQYSDSMRRESLGIKTLTNYWQPFEVTLSHIPEEEFKRVVGGFGWVINWDSNNVLLNEAGTGPEEPKTFIIEIRNIHWDKR